MDQCTAEYRATEGNCPENGAFEAKELSNKRRGVSLGDPRAVRDDALGG